jgi:hypothetical protein
MVIVRPYLVIICLAAYSNFDTNCDTEQLGISLAVSIAFTDRHADSIGDAHLYVVVIINWVRVPHTNSFADPQPIIDENAIAVVNAGFNAIWLCVSIAVSHCIPISHAVGIPIPVAHVVIFWDTK